MHLKSSSVKARSFCLDLNVLNAAVWYCYNTVNDNVVPCAVQQLHLKDKHLNTQKTSEYFGENLPWP